jgi:hypothetical protein
MGKDIDEDLIEATIRRVQGQKNAAPDLEPSAEGHPSGEPEDPIEATVRRVRAQAVATGQRDADETPEPAGATEDEIEAQIRRVLAIGQPNFPTASG